MKNIIIGAVLVIVIGAGAFAFANSGEDNNDTNSSPNLQPSPVASSDGNEPADTNEPADESEPASQTIVYTSDGFSPDSYQVTAGSLVAVRNDSDQVLEFASDDHPTHTKQGELNVGQIAPGEQKTFTPTQPGEWGFHNHLNSLHTGVINVE